MLKRFVVVSVWLVCACGGGGKKESTAPVEQPVESKAPVGEPAAAAAPAPGAKEAAFVKMEEFTTKMCACTDRECANTVSDEMTDWSKGAGKPEPFTDAEQKKAQEIGTKLGECMVNAMNGGSSEPQP